jgi:CTP:molybdopterin cytidylyltransferase MocA
MPPVSVLILAPAPAPDAGPLTRLLDQARDGLAEHHRREFLAAGAADAVIRREPPDDTPFGARLRRLAAELLPVGPAGLVVLGAAAIPLATPEDRRILLEAAADDAPGALANHRYSADVVALARADLTLPSLAAGLDTDNALPRWLTESAQIPVRDLRARRHLAMDVDSPLDLVLLAECHRDGAAWPSLPAVDDAGHVRTRVAALRTLAADPGAEFMLAGRLSAADLRWAERHTRSRALVEERGLRTAAAGALVGRPNRRPPRSVLGELLVRDGPGSLGRHVAALADGALLDSRVLIAHCAGADERGWPPPEDRYASDLLLADRVADPWLGELTAAAAEAPIPILLGGHSLVGPGVRLVLQHGGWATSARTGAMHDAD